jgi:hypothetical protein
MVEMKFISDAEDELGARGTLFLEDFLQWDARLLLDEVVVLNIELLVFML